MNILKDLTNQIKRQTELVERLRSQCEKTTSSISENECQNNSLSKKDDAYARLMDEERKYFNLCHDLAMIVYDQRLSEEHRELLRLWYERGLTVREISLIIGKQKSWIYEIHKQAVKAINSLDWN